MFVALRSELVKESYWIFGAVASVLIISWLLGGNLLSTESVDIQLHDTYLVATPIQWLAFLSITVLFSIYLIRVILNSKRLSLHLALLVFTLMLFVTVLYLRSIYVAAHSGWVVYPPLSAMQVDPGSGFRIVKTLSLVLCIGLLLFSGFLSWKVYNLIGGTKPGPKVDQ